MDKKIIVGYALPSWKQHFKVGLHYESDVSFPWVVTKKTKDNCSRRLYEKGIKVKITIEEIS